MNINPYIFLDTNVINKFVDERVQVSLLNRKLDEKKLKIVISQHTTYELARIFLDTNTREKGIATFQLIQSLDPIFTCQTKQLLFREIQKINTGTPVDFFIENELKECLTNRINEICAGNIHCKGVNFIKERESNFKNDNDVMWDSLFNYEQINNFKFKDWAGSISSNTEHIKSLIQHLCIQHSWPKEINIQPEFSLNNFPALKTYIMANLYLSFIARNNRTSPSKDKTDDFRLLIDASYCKYFVTNDNKLSRIQPNIIPELSLMTYSGLLL